MFRPPGQSCATRFIDTSCLLKGQGTPSQHHKYERIGKSGISEECRIKPPATSVLHEGCRLKKLRLCLVQIPQT